jgi:hypothetical protein
MHISNPNARAVSKRQHKRQIQVKASALWISKYRARLKNTVVSSCSYILLRILIVNIIDFFITFDHSSYSNIKNYMLYLKIFSNKINHNKIYDFSKSILNKTNDQKMSTTSI